MRVMSVLCRCYKRIMPWFGYGFRWLWERILHPRNLILFFLSVPLFWFGRLRLKSSKNGGNEPGDSDENTRTLDNSPDDPERLIDPGQKRSSDTDGEPERKNTKPTFQNYRVNDVDENVHPNESEIRTEEEKAFDSKEYQVDTTDEFYCKYDSTWETDPNEESPPSRTRWPTNSNHYKFSRFERAARDMQNYRHDYPNQIKTQRWQKNANEDKTNLNFYLGNIPSVPDGVCITEFHEKWHGDYEKLEYVHTYIQWLFPLQEPGVNCEASTLTKKEIREFRNNSTAKKNLLKSYKLMLDFYGIELWDEKTGEVKKAKHWKERFDNLNSHTHNSLRITRILKCLGDLGYRHYQAPLVRFFLEETLVNGQLPNIRDSVLSYFMFAVLNKNQRRDLIKYAYMNYEPKDEFVWCPKKIQNLWSMQSKPTVEEEDDSLRSQETASSDSEAQEEDELSADVLCKKNAGGTFDEDAETYSDNEY